MSTEHHPLRERLAALRGPAVPPRPLDARALAALAANPGCRRRAVLDAAGVDKGAVAGRLGAPAPFGQSRFAFSRGHAFEARVKADGCAELLRLLGAYADTPERQEQGASAGAAGAAVPDLSAPGPQGRAARTRMALAEAAPGAWTLLDHPMLALEVAGSTAYLEPDAVAVDPDGRLTVIEIKSFPILDGGADPVKVGAAARQAAVYALALDELAPGRTGPSFLLVCPKDFSNLPTAQWVDVRKQLAVTRRQLARLTRIEEIVAALPEGASFDLAPDAEGAATRPAADLAAAVDAVPAVYAPECLSTCELAFHCRAGARAADRVEALGRSLRADLGDLTTTGAVLAAATGAAGDPDDPAVQALRRAAQLRAEALRSASGAPPMPGACPPPGAEAVPEAGAVLPAESTPGAGPTPPAESTPEAGAALPAESTPGAGPTPPAESTPEARAVSSAESTPAAGSAPAVGPVSAVGPVPDPRAAADADAGTTGAGVGTRPAAGRASGGRASAAGRGPATEPATNSGTESTTEPVAGRGSGVGSRGSGRAARGEGGSA